MKRGILAAPHAALATALMVAAMVLGGGGSPNPSTEILLELTAGALALAWLWLGFLGARSPRPDSAYPWLVAALVLVVPVVQLIPLPAGLWHSLAGQQDRIASLGLVGAQDHWRPMSLSPARTLASLLSVFPPVLALLATASLSTRGRVLLIRAVACVALASALLGAAQVSLGESAPRLYAASNIGVTGFQANKNAAADVLLIGLVALATALAPSLRGDSQPGDGLVTNRRAAWIVLLGCSLVMVFATLLTSSRMGIALIPLAMAGAWAIVSAAGDGARRYLWVPVALIAAAFGVAALAEVNVALGSAFRRFAEHDDPRRELWRDAWFALKRSWPSGIGLGGVEPALLAAERLEVVDPTAPNRVHNDYLEFLLEGGVLAAVVFVSGAALSVRTAWRSWRARSGDRGQILLGCVILAILACHSLVDYPLRSMALACLAGMAAGLLSPPPARERAAAPMREAVG